MGTSGGVALAIQLDFLTNLNLVLYRLLFISYRFFFTGHWNPCMRLSLTQHTSADLHIQPNRRCRVDFRLRCCERNASSKKQVHYAMVMVQHSIPRSALAMDGCQECLRESRGDRVMSHDERTCPEVGTWHVQVLLSWEGQYVRRVQRRWYLSTGTVLLLWRLFGLQCSISRTTWTAASRTSTSRSTGRIPTPVGVGILQAFFNLHEAFAYFSFFQGRSPPRVEFTFLLFKQKRNCTQSLNELLWLEEARISHQSNLLTWTVGPLCLYPQGGESNTRYTLLRSTKGEGGVCGGLSVSRFP